MVRLPHVITSELNRVKGNYPFNVVVKRINGRYYLYRQSGAWDSKSKKTRITSEYLGRITDTGRFMKKRHHAKEDTGSATIASPHHEEIILYDKLGQGITTLFKSQQIRIDEIDQKLLTLLSTDSRTPISTMATALGLGPHATRSRIKRLEKALGLNYILEIDVTKLGYLPYIILVKFKDRQPPASDMERLLQSDYRIQFAGWVKGDYDLVIYAIYEDQLSAFDNMHRLRRSMVLRNCDSIWYVTPFAQTYSFVPLRKEFVGSILKNKAWRRGMPHAYANEGELKQRELMALQELNHNSIGDMSEMDRKHKLGRGSIMYAYHALKERGVIIRSTINANPMQIKYIGIISLKIINVGETYVTWKDRLNEYISYGALFNKYSLIGYTGSPDGAFVFIPVFEAGDMEKARDYLQNTAKTGLENETLVITSTIVGSLCFRRLDNSQSHYQSVLYKLKKIEDRENWENTADNLSDALFLDSGA